MIRQGGEFGTYRPLKQGELDARLEKAYRLDEAMRDLRIARGESVTGPSLRTKDFIRRRQPNPKPNTA